jgi:hypothetical protein
MNGAEWGCKESLLRTLAYRLAGNQPGQVLVADLARQQQQYEDTEAEGRSEATLRPCM